MPLAGADSPTAVTAILSVFPLDSFVETPALRMAPDGTPDDLPPAVQREVQAVVDADAGRALPLGPVERFAFYDLARRAYAVVATGERRFWGCFVLKKGVKRFDCASAVIPGPVSSIDSVVAAAADATRTVIVPSPSIASIAFFRILRSACSIWPRSMATWTAG